MISNASAAAEETMMIRPSFLDAIGNCFMIPSSTIIPQSWGGRGSGISSHHDLLDVPSKDDEDIQPAFRLDEHFGSITTPRLIRPSGLGFAPRWRPLRLQLGIVPTQLSDCSLNYLLKHRI